MPIPNTCQSITGIKPKYIVQKNLQVLVSMMGKKTINEQEM